jgi:hypothetical protein
VQHATPSPKRLPPDHIKELIWKVETNSCPQTPTYEVFLCGGGSNRKALSMHLLGETRDDQGKPKPGFEPGEVRK